MRQHALMTMPTEAVKGSDLPPVASLDGTETMLFVIKNIDGVLTTVRPTVAQLVALVESESGGVADGDYGDVTVSGGGTVITIDDDAVSYAKLQDVSATARVLGRKTAGAGDVEELTLSELLDLVGSAADGDILYRNAGAWTRLAIGADGEALTVVAGAPAWDVPGSGGMTNPMTTAGDIIYGGASGAPTRLEKGASGTYLEMGATNPAWVAKIFNWTSHTTTPNNTVPVRRLVPASGANVDVAITPTGTGSLLARVPDNTAVGGNKRGNYAVDLQLARGSAADVASGNYSGVLSGASNRGWGSYAVVAGGNAGTASGNYSAVPGGQSCAAAGEWSFAMGSGAQAYGAASAALGGASSMASGDYSVSLGGYICQASGTSSVAHGTYGNAFTIENIRVGGCAVGHQLRELPIYAETTDATPKVMASSAAGPVATNQFSLPVDRCAMVRVVVAARQTAGTGTGACAGWDIPVLVKNIGGTVSIVGSPATTAAYADAGASGISVAIDVDAPNGALKVTVTGLASKSFSWTAVIYGAES